MSADLIAQQYTTTYEVILRLTSDISHAESLHQWTFQANCLNWLLGHVTVARLNLLAMLGDRESVWDFSQARRYIPGSAPITSNSTDVTQFDDLRAAFERSQVRFIPAVRAQSDEALTAHRDGRTLASELLYYAQHEAFHTGQIELCRMMIGRQPVRGFE